VEGTNGDFTPNKFTFSGKVQQIVGGNTNKAIEFHGTVKSTGSWELTLSYNPSFDLFSMLATDEEEEEFSMVDDSTPKKGGHDNMDTEKTHATAKAKDNITGTPNEGTEEVYTPATAKDNKTVTTNEVQGSKISAAEKKRNETAEEVIVFCKKRFNPDPNQPKVEARDYTALLQSIKKVEQSKSSTPAEKALAAIVIGYMQNDKKAYFGKDKSA